MAARHLHELDRRVLGGEVERAVEPAVERPVHVGDAEAEARRLPQRIRERHRVIRPDSFPQRPVGAPLVDAGAAQRIWDAL